MGTGVPEYAAMLALVDVHLINVSGRRGEWVFMQAKGMHYEARCLQLGNERALKD